MDNDVKCQECGKVKTSLEIIQSANPPTYCINCGKNTQWNVIEAKGENHMEHVDPNRQLSEHFQAYEFFCHDGTPFTTAQIIFMEDLLDFLERLRFGINLKIPEAGDIGIHVVSGFRHEAYNKEVGGAANSGHLFENGAAADVEFTNPKISVGMLWQVTLEVDKSFPTRPYRLGNYEKSRGEDAWVHVGCDYHIGGTRWFK